MYAVATPSLVYHLVKDHRTLCGLFVVGELRLIAHKPTDRILCKHCEHAARPKPPLFCVTLLFYFFEHVGCFTNIKTGNVSLEVGLS